MLDHMSRQDPKTSTSLSTVQEKDMNETALDDVESYSDDGNVSKLTWNKLENACHSEGFREGLVEGKERKLQKGFDQGYLSGFKESQNLAEMKGFLSAVILQSTDLVLNEKLKKILDM